MKIKLPKHGLCLCLLLLGCSITFTASSQVTTASLSGTVSSQTDSKVLPGATVQISFEDAGIKKTVVTGSDGSFLVPNLRVGGPYTVTVTFTGYNEKKENNIFLELGQNTALELKLDAATTTLTNVVLTTRSKIFDNQRTGASTNITSRQLKTLPTISRLCR
ncbi:MAG: carboxypeptidase-like regulatory domain-containing protein [Ferruginibacter sp.]